MTEKKRSLKKKLLRISLSILIALALILVLFFLFSENVCELKDKNPQMTSFMKLRENEARAQKKTFQIKKIWTPLNRIPNILVQGVLSSEDDRFFNHGGVDWKEIRQALKKQNKTGKNVRGASTISQQLIKNLYLSPKRSLMRKLKELILTLKLEYCVGKKRILECYLNVVEFGRGIFGVEAASRHFFSKSVSDLSLEEILRLISVIPKPLRVSPLSNSQYTRWRIKWIAERLMRKKTISPDQYLKIAEKYR